ncbi:MAG: cupin domain-containing protein [Gammaproteobacteria bacterium]|nr:cupin domain-containing protein [Gammaproteobacteria bacterium]MDH3768174.1 cupin domain-containing protein [Gammaproteobacteria bacterium]
MALRFPASIDAQRFLSDYWQRQPLLLPNAMSDELAALESVLTPADLAGLACENDVEARLITTAGSPGQWQLRHGPFRSQDFQQLPATGWTLLVQDVDKYVPEVTALRDQFNFLPSWRIDDVMISYAVPGGSVGAHIDQYDVFLVQGAGNRRWDIGRSNGVLIADAPLRVLEQFEVEQHWDLTTGDVLYLPPGIAHHGLSDVACMTVSVGFRAPSAQELVMGQAEYQAEQVRGRYSDAGLTLDESDDGLISTAAVERALALVHETPGQTSHAVNWFGRLVTENKPWLAPSHPDSAETKQQFLQRLQDGENLLRHLAVRMARSEFPGHGLLFVDGVAWSLTAGSRKLARPLCRGDLLQNPGDDDALALLYDLYCDSKLYWASDD